MSAGNPAIFPVGGVTVKIGTVVKPHPGAVGAILVKFAKAAIALRPTERIPSLNAQAFLEELLEHCMPNSTPGPQTIVEMLIKAWRTTLQELEKHEASEDDVDLVTFRLAKCQVQLMFFTSLNHVVGLVWDTGMEQCEFVLEKNGPPDTDALVRAAAAISEGKVWQFRDSEVTDLFTPDEAQEHFEAH